MKRVKFMTLLMLLMTALTASAGTQFVPKDYSYTEVGADSDKSFYVYFYQLFTYPDEISTKTDISKMEGITINTSCGDESLVTLTTIGQHMNQTRLQLKRLGLAKGETTFTVSITYNGETVTNTFPIRILGLETETAKSYIEPTAAEPQVYDVIGSTKFFSSAEKTACTLTLDNANLLKYGTAELVDGENGYKVIQYTLNGTPDRIVSDAIKYTITLSDGVDKASDKVVVYATRNCYATKILEYQPAAGQFRVENAWDNPVEFFESNQRGLSLGALGGYVVLGFDQPIYNNPQNPYGVDFTVEGNSFVAAEKGVWTEPGAVQVMEDKNGNGLPDDGEWYELAGSDYWLSTTRRNVELTYYNPHYNDRYTVPWEIKWEENGVTHKEYGAVVTNNFHKHTFYPDYYYNNDNPDPAKRWYNPAVSRDSITFKGLTQIRGCIDMRSPSYIEFYNYSGFGYCDNKGFVKGDSRIASNPYGRPALGEEAGDGMDISWAVDKDGNYVDLEKIDFVKVYTAGQVIAGWLGEWSSEVLDCAMTLPDPDYVPQDYYYNYVGITQLQVPLGQTCQYEGLLFKNGRLQKDINQKWWITMDKEGQVTEGADAIATIDNNGLLSANGYGTVWVHFTAMDGIPHESFEVSVCNLTAVVISLEGNEGAQSETADCVVGERIYINVESEDDNSQSVNTTKSNRFIYDNYTWHNSNPEVGSIDKGNFIALKPGVTTLTAFSGVNPSLFDQITINVLDVPEVEVKPIHIAANKPVGELLNSDVFYTSNGSTVYMDDVKVQKGLANVSLYNNHLSYQFTEGEYVTDVLEFTITHYGKQSTVEVPITYGPYNRATAKKLLMISSYDENGVDTGVAQLQGVDFETHTQATYVDELPEGTTDLMDIKDNLLADGTYAYATRGTSLQRYDVEWGKKVAEATLTSDEKHQLATYTDKLLVSDANELKVFYRTDLKAFKTIALNGTIKHVTLDGDAAYILCATDGAATMNKLDLTTWTLTQSNVEMEGGANASGMYLHNDKLYIATGETTAGPASMVVYNTANNSSTVTTATLEGLMSVPFGASAHAGNTIMVSRGSGFIAYNLETETFDESSSHMYVDMMVPLHATAETYEVEGEQHERYYVTYNVGVGVYESPDFSSPIAQPFGVPTAMTIMQATEENEAPTLKKDWAYTSKIYELQTNKSISKGKLSTYFNDAEGATADNITMYIREDLDWLTETYATDGSLTPKLTTVPRVDAETEHSFDFECIDKYGASVKGKFSFTLYPRIYKPLIAELDMNITSAGNDVTASRAIVDIFNQNGQNAKCTLETTVTAVGNNSLISSAVVDGDNLVLTVPAGVEGETTIELTQKLTHSTASYGSKEFKAVIPVVITSNKAESIALDASQKEMTVGEQFTLTATILPEVAAAQEVAWTSTNESVATVENGVVTAVGVGNAIITATTTDGTNLTASCVVTVNPILATSIALDATEKEVLIGEEFTLVATVLPGDVTNGAVEWTTTDPTVATVEDGVVTAVGVGNAIITATTTDGTNLTASCVVTVNPILATSIALDATEKEVLIGEEFTLVATVLPTDVTNGAVEWTTTDPTVATVEDGVVTAVGVGNAIITATTTDGTNLTASCVVTVNPILATSIALDATEKEVLIGEEFTLVATVLPGDVTNGAVVWTTTDPTVATVDDGVVTAVGLGNAIITATTTDGTNLTASCVVTVNPILATSIALDATEKEVLIGEEFTLVATVLPGDVTNGAVVWTTTDPTVATVEDGVVTAVGLGNAIITATTTDGSNLTASCVVTVNPILATEIYLDVTTKTSVVDDEFTLVATVLPYNTTNKEVAWSSSNEQYATVDSNGYVRIKREGNVTITASTTDGSNLSATCEISIITGLNDMSVGSKVYVENNNIVVEGASDKAMVYVYTTSGTQIALKQAQGGYATISVPYGSTYIVKYDDKIVKIAVL